jgi:hypothetical protein
VRAAYISLDAAATPTGKQASGVFSESILCGPARAESNVLAYRSRAYHPAYPTKWDRREFEATLARLVETWVGINEAVG